MNETLSQINFSKLLDTFSLLYFFSIVGTQLLLTLILANGDICPGQINRLNKLFKYLSLAWLITLPSNIYHAIPMVSTWVFTYLTLRKEEKRPRKISTSYAFIYLSASNILSMILLLLLFFEDANLSALYLSQFILLGCTTTQTCLSIAKSRLQAFHKILPVTCIFAVILLSLNVIYQNFIHHELLVNKTDLFFISYFFIIMGSMLSIIHMLRQTSPSTLQLTFSAKAFFIGNLILLLILN